MPDMTQRPEPVQPVDGTVVPRYAGFSTFARLPRIDDVADLRRRRGGDSVRHRSELSPGRALRTRPRSAVLAGAAALPPPDGGDAVRHPAGRRRGRYRLHALRHREGDDSDRGAGERTDRRRRAAHHASVATTRSPIRCCARINKIARTGGAGALRRAPRHVGHLLRRPADPRHSVPAGRRGGPLRIRPQRPRRDQGSRCTRPTISRRMPNWVSPSCTAASSKHVPSQTWSGN